jgi:hypothetical protein
VIDFIMYSVNDYCYLFPHLGLGDLVICNGLVREYAKKFRLVFLPCKEHNLTPVRWMFSDIQDRVIIVPVLDDADAENLVSASKSPVFRLGKFTGGFKREDLTWMEEFYANADLPYSKALENFHVPRKEDVERDILLRSKETHFGTPQKHVFVHDVYPEHPLRQEFLEDFAKRGLEVIKSDYSLTDNIFDYMGILETAEEIHCMSSCFICLVDCMPNIKTKRLFWHRYVRKEYEALNFRFFKQWKEVK